MGESRGVSPAKNGVVRFTEGRMNIEIGEIRCGNMTKIRSRREGF